MDWPFDQEPTTAALTMRQVLDEEFPILNVVHYSDDHSWAFTCGTTNEPDHGRIVCMSHMIERDPTVANWQISNPAGVAHRDKIGADWIRYQVDEM